MELALEQIFFTGCGGECNGKSRLQERLRGKKLHTYMHTYRFSFMENEFKCFRLYFHSNNKIGENDSHYLFEHMEQF